MIIHRKKGVTLLETIIYVAIFSATSLLVMYSFGQVIKTFYELRASRDINDSAVKVMERLTRDLRSATSFNVALSNFGTANGQLTFDTITASGTTATVRYFLTGDDLHLAVNGVDQGSLLSGLSTVDALVFRSLPSGTRNPAGVKIELHLSTRRGDVESVGHYYNTIYPRGLR